jgi:5-methylcytosine-specific restriction endonuclease McrA
MAGCAGICQDAAHPVDPSRRRPDPLSSSVDHVTPIARGGTHTRANVQITHWYCNHEANADDKPSPAYASALLRRRLYSTPVPARIWMMQWHPPTSRRGRLG